MSDTEAKVLTLSSGRIDIDRHDTGVTVSDYPPVQVTPGGNLKLISSFKLPSSIYRVIFNDNTWYITFIFFITWHWVIFGDTLIFIIITLGSLG